MIDIKQYAENFKISFAKYSDELPWHTIKHIEVLLKEKLSTLSGEYVIRDNIAVHKTARIEEHCVIKGPLIISEGCFVGANAYLRGGVFLDSRVVVGPGTEIKSSIILSDSALAHFNFIGDSIIGSRVNMEAGSVIANHYNERKDKTIFVSINGKHYPIDSQKFGALAGDDSRIGANAVLSPGTILHPHSIVKRLALVEQCA